MSGVEDKEYIDNYYEDFKRIRPIERYHATEWSSESFSSPHRKRNLKLQSPYQKNPFNDNERRASTPTTRDRRQLGEMLLNVLDKSF